MQLAGKEDMPPLQGGQLYTLPSMQFLESMLSDFDRTGTSGGGDLGMGSGGPLDLPGDAFDLPGLGHPAAARQHTASAAMRPTPFDQEQHAAQQFYAHPPGGPAAAYSGFVPTAGSAPASLQAQLGTGMHSSGGSLTLQASVRAHSAYEARLAAAASLAAPSLQAHQMLMQQQAAAAAAAARHAAPAASQGVRQPAVPQPAQPRATPRRTSQAYADFEYEEAEVSLQTSKSGRVRKVGWLHKPPACPGRASPAASGTWPLDCA
jgi:hypothetical protein